MVPDEWQDFIANTIAQVESGELPMARIDDAVSRILPVKLRAGLVADGKPSSNAHAGKAEALQHRALASEAVRKSLVALKHRDRASPRASGHETPAGRTREDEVDSQSGGRAQ